MKLNNLIKCGVATLTLFTLMSGNLKVSAAEYSIIDVNAIMYTNGATGMYSDADLNALTVPQITPGLPVAVTGITTNGYFRINVGDTVFYVPGNGLSTDANSVQNSVTEQPVVATSAGINADYVNNKLNELRAKHPNNSKIAPEPMQASYDKWNKSVSADFINSTIAYFSDYIFGADSIPKQINSVDEIKIGDTISGSTAITDEEGGMLIYILNGVVTKIDKASDKIYIVYGETSGEPYRGQADYGYAKITWDEYVNISELRAAGDNYQYFTCY